MDSVQVEQVAIAQMDGGERLLWSGTPSPGAMALSALPASLFGIPFAGFACFWIWTAYSSTSHMTRGAGPWAFFPLFGVPFLLVGLGMITAPLWVALAAGKTVYAVTERRLLIINGLGVRGVQSFTPKDVDDLLRVEGADGRGSIYFAKRSFTSSRGAQVSSRIGFVGIPDVRHVEQLIRSQMERAAA
jgi:hypothetical protein